MYSELALELVKSKIDPDDFILSSYVADPEKLFNEVLFQKRLKELSGLKDSVLKLKTKLINKTIKLKHRQEMILFIINNEA